jgi:CHAD domain-containing protein
MTSDVKKMARRLKKRRHSLLHDYHHEDLHQLRITLRRIRSLLKQVPGRKARQLRRDLGQLASTTNAARDWDTLAIYAQDKLTQEQFSQLQPRLEERQAVTHQRVRKMLRSKKWSAAAKQWKEFTRDEDLGSNSPSYTRDKLSRVSQRAASAGRRALSRGDDKSWHKLRIAIKELRYTLDNLPKHSRDPETVKTLAWCKRSQEDLGAWHDTVVHRQLSNALADSREPPADINAVNAMNTLCQIIEQEGHDCLERVRSTLE